MSLGNSRPSPIRCLGVLAVATGAAAQAVALVLPHLRETWSHPALLVTAPFDQTLVHLSAVALAGCAAWLWLGVLLTTLDAAAGLCLGPPVLPAGVRRVVLAACGVAVLGASPAVADPGSLVGLPLPERASVALPHDHRPPSQVAPPPAPAIAPAPALTVAAGDTLWAIAARHLPPDAPAGEVAAATHRLHRLNRAVIGPDPDRLVPGQHLRLPRSLLSRKDTT